MTVKEWLWRGRRIEREIETLEKAREETYTRLVSAVSAPDKIVVSATKDPHLFDTYAAFSEKLASKVSELIAVRVEIIQAIDQLPERQHRILLTDRYIRSMSWEEICVEMHYSWKHVHRLHGYALLAMSQFFQQEKKEDIE